MKNEKKEQENQNLNIEIKEIELPSIDIQKYIGKKVVIENVFIREGTFGKYVKIETVPVKIIQTPDIDIEIKGTNIYSLQLDKDGVLGWGKNSKLGKFLEKYNIKQPKEMIGKEVTLQAKDKEGTLFLTFI